ncbi:hypothetical protein [Haliangium sp. UPWRP_2]|uniref:hypothetical protein n=1 Tax=Haliangium sp. UPWRP_2 TaxID=1931276 RepID=UPI000B545D74|nr:hypothetical protein [Haliangium sp. UPWRP_2]PSM31275.1 hypothetical protein BVG81_006255 [Haliangium sp. UPWRP_2]
MENRVGDKTPGAADIQKQVKIVEDLAASLGKYCVTLLPSERQTLSRGRLGIEGYLSRMADVAERFSFNVPGSSPDGLRNDIRTYQELAPLQTALEKALQLVQDTRAVARSEATEAGLLYYSLAQSAAARSPELELAVRDMREFMAHGPRRKKDPTPTPNPTP